MSATVASKNARSRNRSASTEAPCRWRRSGPRNARWNARNSVIPLSAAAVSASTESTGWTCKMPCRSRSSLTNESAPGIPIAAHASRKKKAAMRGVRATRPPSARVSAVPARASSAPMTIASPVSAIDEATLWRSAPLTLSRLSEASPRSTSPFWLGRASGADRSGRARARRRAGR
ncbi:hypothetical protein BE20_26945 [Sorangium cellulosum]|nr:hypothetical protein BE20_26945 [Sorangium cellulosum]